MRWVGSRLFDRSSGPTCSVTGWAIFGGAYCTVSWLRVLQKFTRHTRRGSNAVDLSGIYDQFKNRIAVFFFCFSI
jgi:hypothetical protein